MSETYSITEFDGKKETKREVEASCIAYDVIGVRQDGKFTILDHIPSGGRIGRFKSERKALDAIRELMQVSNFKWKEVPPGIREPVRDILKRYAV